MQKFLADESLDFRVVQILREDGYEITAIIEINPSIDDEDILKMANELGAILLTEDKDFGELTFRLRKPNKGIILIRMSGVPLEIKVEKIKYVLSNYLDQLSNSFTVIKEKKVRIKKQE